MSINHSFPGEDALCCEDPGYSVQLKPDSSGRLSQESDCGDDISEYIVPDYGGQPMSSDESSDHSVADTVGYDGKKNDTYTGVIL
jgi:hypothetical protein